MADLVLRGLTVSRGGRRVLEDCSAEFPGGHRTVLWGPSGAGKSTLLLAIAGLLTPAAGTIRIGPDVLFDEETGLDTVPHRRGVGFVFQDLALWPHLRAVDQVLLVGKAAGLEREDALALLGSVGLRELAKRRPEELSGGEQQRLAIARALAGKPQMLLLDEPFGAVDPDRRRELRALVREISPRIPGPTIYVTHDESDARDLAEKTFRIGAGTLAETPNF